MTEGGGDAVAEEPPPPPERLWVTRRPYGHARALGTLASGPMAVLAGFTLAAAVALSVEDTELLDHAAMIVFGLAAATLIWGLHLASEAEGLFSTPAEHVEWQPEIAGDTEKLANARISQRLDFAAYWTFRRRSLNAYHAGSAIALVGLALLLCARIDGSALSDELDEDTLRDLLSAVGALAVLVVALLVASFSPRVHEVTVRKSSLSPRARRKVAVVRGTDVDHLWTAGGGSPTIGEVRYGLAAYRGAGDIIAVDGDADAQVIALTKVTERPLPSPPQA